MFSYEDSKYNNNIKKVSFFHITSQVIKCHRPSADSDSGDSLISDECCPTVQKGGHDLSLTSETTYAQEVKKRSFKIVTKLFTTF